MANRTSSPDATLRTRGRTNLDMVGELPAIPVRLYRTFVAPSRNSKYAETNAAPVVTILAQLMVPVVAASAVMVITLLAPRFVEGRVPVKPAGIRFDFSARVDAAPLVL